MTTAPPSPTPAIGNSLDARIQEICSTYGVSAVGKSFARLYGRTQALQAILGYLHEPAGVPATPPPLATRTPANEIGIAGLSTSHPAPQAVANRAVGK